MFEGLIWFLRKDVRVFAEKDPLDEARVSSVAILIKDNFQLEYSEIGIDIEALEEVLEVLVGGLAMGQDLAFQTSEGELVHVAKSQLSKLINILNKLLETLDTTDKLGETREEILDKLGETREEVLP